MKKWVKINFHICSRSGPTGLPPCPPTSEKQQFWFQEASLNPPIIEVVMSLLLKQTKSFAI